MLSADKIFVDKISDRQKIHDNVSEDKISKWQNIRQTTKTLTKNNYLADKIFADKYTIILGGGGGGEYCQLKREHLAFRQQNSHI